MFILVNHSTENGIANGIEEIGRYDTREEAAKEIANEIISTYNVDIDIDDFIVTYHPYDNGDFRYDDDNTHVWFNNYECACCNDDGCEDDWLVIEV